jgi:hypothetical protein
VHCPFRAPVFAIGSSGNEPSTPASPPYPRSGPELDWPGLPSRKRDLSPREQALKSEHSTGIASDWARFDVASHDAEMHPDGDEVYLRASTLAMPRL